jgi:putative hydrolase of the HAD superfamily
MVKAIIFDIGKVLVDFDNDLFIRKISKTSNKSSQEIHDLIYNSSNLTKEYEAGKISSQEFFNKSKKLCKLKISKENFQEAYSNIFTPIDDSLDLVKKLKKKYQLALLSNISEWDFEIGIKPILKDLFKEMTLSYKVKYLKPAKEIYLDLINKLNLNAEECIFIDDLEKNVIGAKKIGIKTIQYKSYKNLLKELRKLGVEI